MDYGIVGNARLDVLAAERCKPEVELHMQNVCDCHTPTKIRRTSTLLQIRAT